MLLNGRYFKAKHNTLVFFKRDRALLLYTDVMIHRPWLVPAFPYPFILRPPFATLAPTPRNPHQHSSVFPMCLSLCAQPRTY